MTLNKHASEIAAPIAANPSKTLAQILGTVFKRGLNFSFLVILHSDFPIVCVKPARDKVIVVGVELASPPLFVGKSVGESFVLQDATAVSGAASRQAGKTPIDVQTCGAVEVSAFEVCGTQEIPDADTLSSLQSLRGANTAHLGVLKGCQHPLQNLGWPDDIVVDEDGDFGGDFGNGSAHLSTLVRLPDAQDPQLFSVDLVRDFGECLDIGVDGDEDHLVRLGLQTCFDGAVEFLAPGGDGG